MRIEKQTYPECVFGDITVGNTFMLDNALWMAIEEVLIKEDGDLHSVNAVNLEDGTLEFICNEEVVFDPEVKVVIR